MSIPDYLKSTLGEGLGSMAGTAGTALISRNPALTFGIAAGTEGGSLMNEIESITGDRDLAADVGTTFSPFMGAAEAVGATKAVGVSDLINDAVKRQAVKRIATETGKAAGVEAGTEVLQSGLGEAAKSATGNPSSLSEIGSDILNSALSGGITGGTVRGSSETGREAINAVKGITFGVRPQPTEAFTETPIETPQKPVETIIEDDGEFVSPIETTPSEIIETTPQQVIETTEAVKPESKPIKIARTGKKGDVVTPNQQIRAKTEYAIAELGDLVQATEDLQTRDRESIEMRAEEIKRASILNPEMLEGSVTSDQGSPIVMTDGTIVAGNGRARSLNYAYENIPEKGDAYRAYLKEQGYNTEGYKNPVLVRVLPENDKNLLKDFARYSNEPAIARHKPSETAKKDAESVTANIELYKGGDVALGSNSRFVRAFASSLPASEYNTISNEGMITRDGRNRVEAAMLAAAYPNDRFLNKLLNDADTDIKSIANALLEVAPNIVVNRKDKVPEKFDISENLVAAAQFISDARSKYDKQPIVKAFDQIDAFNKLDDLTEALVRSFYNPELTRQISQKNISEKLERYFEEASKKKQAELLEDDTSPMDILEVVNQEEAVLLDKDSKKSPTKDSSGLYTRGNDDYSIANDLGIDADRFDAMAMDKKLKMVRAKIKKDFAFKEVLTTNLAAPNQVLNQLMRLYTGFKELALTLGVSTESIGLYGNLSFVISKKGGGYLGAFWSEGMSNFQGGKIKGRNKTKKGEGLNLDGAVVELPAGSNSFAHEFMHALDNYIFKTNNILDATKKRSKKMMSNAIKNGISVQPQNISEAFVDVLKTLYFDDAGFAAKRIQDLSNGKDNPFRLANIRRQGGSVYKRVKNDEYLRNPMELIARAFEVYVADKINSEGVAKPKSYYEFDKAYPLNTEKMAVFNAFDNLFAMLAVEGLMQKKDGSMATPQAITRALFQQAESELNTSNKRESKKVAGKEATKAGAKEAVDAVKVIPSKMTENESLSVVFRSAVGHLKTLQNKYKSPTIGKLVTLLEKSDTGLEPLQEQSQEALKLQNIVTNVWENTFVLNPDDAKTSRYIVDVLVGNVDVDADVVLPVRALKSFKGDAQKVAKQEAIRAIAAYRSVYSRSVEWAAKNGTKISEAKDYFPFLIDSQKAIDDEAGFKSAANKAYKSLFNRTVDTAAELNALIEEDGVAGFLVEKDLSNVVSDIKKDAQSVLNDKDMMDKLGDAIAEWDSNRWFSSISFDSLDSNTGGSGFSPRTRGRIFDGKEHKILNDFRDSNVRAISDDYVMKLVRHVVWQKYFSNEILQSYDKAMAKEGLDANERAAIIDLVKTIMRRDVQSMPMVIRNLSSVAGLAFAVAALPKLALLQIVEPFVGAVRKGEWRRPYKVFGNQVVDIINRAEKRETDAIAMMLGIYGRETVENALESRFEADQMTSWARKTTSKFFKSVGMEKLMQNQQRAILKIGLTSLYQMAFLKDISNYNDTLNKISGDIDTDTFIKFVKENIDPNDWAKTLSNLDREGGISGDIVSAISKFIKAGNDLTIINPNPSDRPVWANNAIGSFFFRLSAFTYAVAKNIFIPAFKNNAAAWRKGIREGSSMTIAQSIAVGQLWAAQAMMQYVSLAVFNPELLKEMDEDDELLDFLLWGGFLRTGILGAGEIALRMWESIVRFNQSPGDVVGGPNAAWLITLMKNAVIGLFTRNSPNTVTAEKKSARAWWEIAQVLIGMGLLQLNKPLGAGLSVLGMEYRPARDAMIETLFPE